MAAAVKLSPPQEAWGDYTRHTLLCAACRDVDRTCETGTDLWRAWREVSEDAARRLRGETA